MTRATTQNCHGPSLPPSQYRSLGLSSPAEEGTAQSHQKPSPAKSNLGSSLPPEGQVWNSRERPLWPLQLFKHHWEGPQDTAVHPTHHHHTSPSSPRSHTLPCLAGRILLPAHPGARFFLVLASQGPSSTALPEARPNPSASSENISQLTAYVTALCATPVGWRRSLLST